MKLTEFIERLQKFKNQIEENCSHPDFIWDKVNFVIKTNTDKNHDGYDSGDYEHLKQHGYYIDLLPGCKCQSTLTIGFVKEETENEI